MNLLIYPFIYFSPQATKSRRQSMMLKRIDVAVTATDVTSPPSKSPVMRRTRRMSMAVNAQKKPLLAKTAAV